MMDKSVFAYKKILTALAFDTSKTIMEDAAIKIAVNDLFHIGSEKVLRILWFAGLV